MNKKKKAAFIINLLTVPLEILAFAIRPDRYGIPALCFYTVLSNILVLVSSVFYLIALKKQRYAKLTSVLRYSSAVMLSVTFLIVVFVLVWFTDPVDVLFDRNNLFHHILIPAATVVSYLFFENKITGKRMVFVPLAFSLVYTFILVSLNAKGIINGPYPFFMVQIIGMPKVILTCIGLMIVFYLLCRAVYQLGIINADKHERSKK